MGYNPQRNRPRPRVSDSAGPAPVDALLDQSVPPSEPVTETPVASESIVAASEPSEGTAAAVVAEPRRRVAAAPLLPATPTPARVAPLGRIVAVAVTVVVVLVALRVLGRRRRHR